MVRSIGVKVIVPVPAFIIIPFITRVSPLTIILFIIVTVGIFWGVLIISSISTAATTLPMSLASSVSKTLIHSGLVVLAQHKVERLRNLGDFQLGSTQRFRLTLFSRKIAAAKQVPSLD